MLIYLVLKLSSIKPVWVRSLIYSICSWKKIDHENRWIDFAVIIIDLDELISDSKSAKHISSQLIRSETSPALNYGEVQSGESRKDFIHKLKIVLKKFWESHVSLRIIHKSILCKNAEKLLAAITEGNVLISIFIKSIETAERNVFKKS